MVNPAAPRTTAQVRTAALIGVVILFSLFANLLLLTGPLFMLQVYDRVLTSHSVETLVALTVLVAALFAIYALIEYARSALMARIAARFQLSLGAAALAAAGAGRACRADPADPDRVAAILASPLALAVIDLPWTVLFLAAIFALHPLLGWVSAAGAAVLMLAALGNWLATRAALARARSAARHAGRIAAETARSASTVAGLGMGAALFRRWQARQSDAVMARLDAAGRTGAIVAASRAIRLFLQSAVMAAGAVLVLQGQISAGAMVAGSILLGRALGPLEAVLSGAAPLAAGLAAWAQLTRQAGIDAAAAAPAVWRRQDGLTAERLSLVPAPGHAPVLSAVGFRLQPGQALGVIGGNGAGKTALTRVLVGLDRPTAGRLRGPSAPRQVGYLPQQVDLFTGTVAENISRMHERPDTDAVSAAARLAGLHEAVLDLPAGYATVIAPDGPALSLGMRQRLGLARAFYGAPPMVVLDDPAAALDSAGVAALGHAIAGHIRRGGLVVMTMRHLPAIAALDRLLVLERGRVIAQGQRDQVMAAMSGQAGRPGLPAGPVPA